MTIHELLQAAGLTANDEIPIWDVDGTGEPTKKITAQQLAAAVVALANLVTGVKGDKESNYRHGDVNLTPANIGAKPTQTAVADPTASGTAVAFIDSITQNANGVITPTKKTVRSASQSESGLMSAADKKKLDGIAAGAQVNSLTGVKGNAESNYRTGNVNLTPANIAFIGTNPTGGASNDTREWWASKGTCYAIFSALNQVNGQPNQYGFLISIVYGAEVHQEWWTQPNGAHYHRGGNVNTSAMPGWAENVTGVKGNAESSYRTGNVNLTPENIGAVQLIVDADSKTSYSFDMAFSGGAFKLGLITYCASGLGTANGAALYLIAIAKSGEIAVHPLSLGSAAPTVTAFSRVNDTVTMTFSGTVWGGIRILWLGN